MRIRLSLVPCIAVVTAIVAGCGGGGGGDSRPDVCSTLKIAGGAECPEPPKSIVVVRTTLGYCSGTFITKRQVLTAAHCFPFNGSRSATIVSQYFSYTATNAQIHPSFNPFVASDQNDVAIVTVGSDAPVDPVPLNSSVRVKDGDSVVTYGFGLDQSDDTYNERIQAGEAPAKATSLDVIGVSDFAIVTLSDGYGDTCLGDSGASLLLTGTNGQPGIIAIVRAGPPLCKVEGGSSDNTNLQASSVLNFVKGAAPGVKFN